MMDLDDARPSYQEPDLWQYPYISANDSTIADVTRLSPYLWNWIDLSFSAVFALAFLVLTLFSFRAEWKVFRSFFGVRSLAVFGLCLAYVLLFVWKACRAFTQLDNLDYISSSYAITSNVLQDGLIDGSRLVLLVVLSRTAVNMVRSWLVPERRKPYEYIAWTFLVPVGLALFAGCGFKLFIIPGELSPPPSLSARFPDDYRAFDDLLFLNALVYTLAMDATFFLINGAALTLIVCSWTAHKDRRVFFGYITAALAFQFPALIRLVFIPVLMVNDDIDSCVWDHRQGFLKPLTGDFTVYALKTWVLTFETVLFGLVSIIGMSALVSLGRIRPANLSNDLDLQHDDYTDDEPHAQPTLTPRDGRLIEYADDDEEDDEPPRYQDSVQRSDQDV